MWDSSMSFCLLYIYMQSHAENHKVILVEGYIYES